MQSKRYVKVLWFVLGVLLCTACGGGESIIIWDPDVYASDLLEDVMTRDDEKRYPNPFSSRITQVHSVEIFPHVEEVPTSMLVDNIKLRGVVSADPLWQQFRLRVRVLVPREDGTDGFDVYYSASTRTSWHPFNPSWKTGDCSNKRKTLCEETLRVQLEDIPLKPGVPNKVTLEQGYMGELGLLWESAKLHIHRKYAVYPVKLHLVLAGDAYRFPDEPASLPPRLIKPGTDVPPPHGAYSFAKIFDRYARPDNSTSTECHAVVCDRHHDTPCKNDADCDMQAGEQCHTVRGDWNDGYLVKRVCRPRTCLDLWSVDQAFSPILLPPAKPAGFEYENCGVLFRVEDKDPSDGWNPDDEIHRIDLLDEENLAYLKTHPNTKDYFKAFDSHEETVEGLKEDYNCGKGITRDMAAALAQRDGELFWGDGAFHVFFTRSICDGLWYGNCVDCTTENPARLLCCNGCSQGFSERTKLNNGKELYLVWFAMQLQCHDVYYQSRNIFYPVFIAAHELGHAGGYFNHFDRPEAPESGNLMQTDPNASCMEGLQNAHFFSSDEVDLCDLFKDGINNLRGHLINLNARKEQ